MYLSKLEILGFKSFPHKTEIVFDEGVTVIVGPNGCGKTNILDALRWVLGEQRTSLLRGERMEHVIFNGTKELKPLGMAEVSLTILNNQGILPTEYQEVNITRRLFRSGESEYLLNKKICRLKDIIDLFLDTGMGTHAYSVIQPEMVESILSNKTEDRRFLFEEASGISKFKHRKKESLRKLETTENDLLRLKDLTSEVEKQVNSLRRQVRKSERFIKLSQEVKDLELKFSKNQYELLRTGELELGTRLSHLEGERIAQQAKISELELGNERLRLDLTQAEKNYFSFKKELDGCLEILHSLEKEMALLQERKLNLEDQRKKAEKEIEANSSRGDSVAQEIQDREKKAREVLEQIDTKEKEHGGKENEFKLLDQKLNELRVNSAAIDARLGEVEELVHQKELEEQNLKAQLKELERKRKSLAEEKEDLGKNLQTVDSHKEDLSNSILSLQKNLDEKAREKTDIQEKLSSTQKSLESLNINKVAVEKEKSSLTAKFELFRDMVEHYEGYQAGVKAVLDKRESIPGLVAPVANIISTEKEYLTAIEIALGEAAQYILSQDFSSAQSGIKLLKEEKKGRATFLILDRFQGQKFDDRMELEGNGTKGWAKDFVRCREEYKPVIDFLLGRIALTDSLQNGIELSSRLGRSYGVVTLDGHMIRDGKVIEGGSEKEIFLVGREEELNEISEGLTSLEEKLSQLNKEMGEKEQAKSDLFVWLDSLDKKTEEEKSRYKELELDLARQEEIKKGLAQRSEVLRQKEEELESELALLKEQEGVSKLGEQQEKRMQLEQEYNKLKGELNEIETERESAYLRLNELRIELVTLQGREEQIRNEVQRLKEFESELKTNREMQEKETEVLTSEIKGIDTKLVQQQAELEKRQIEKEEKEEQAENLKQELENTQQSLVSQEEDLKIQRRKKDEQQEVWHKLEMEKLELSTNRENLKKKIWEEQEKDLEKVEELSEEEETGMETYPQKISELKDRLKQMGAVNLLASEEYHQQKERLDFLQKQMQDLIEAKENLVSTIDRINKTATELFLNTFQIVKVNFQKVFEQLFEGGEAEVNLIEGLDPLESPIEISARPMGKKLINISQLSGGEKALTALSLLFALYLVKPSPFCILDEVDAPLDDANLTRFINLIKSFSQKTQFIIISHNKLTMESADVLYGVTMEKAGVSKMVSVRLNPKEVIKEAA